MIKLQRALFFGFALAFFSDAPANAEIVTYDPPKLMIADPLYECIGNGGGGITIKSKVRASKRCYPGVPEECKAGLKFREEVNLLVDIDFEGAAQNVRIVNTTYECLNDEVASAISQWMFKNKGAEMKDAGIRVRFVSHGNLHE